jgi:tRNA A37 threonylcarbamoyladenosine dehydratase
VWFVCRECNIASTESVDRQVGSKSAAQQNAPAQVVAAFKQTLQEPLDSAKRAALREPMKFDLVGVDCMFEEAC